MAGRFADRLTHRLPGFRDVARIMASGGFHTWRQPKDAGHEVPRVEGAGLQHHGTGLALTWVGHATYVVQLDGKVFVTDPVWNPRIPGNVRRLTEPGIPLRSLPRVDGILVSHNHYDHLDAWTVKQFPRGTPVVCPLGTGKWFRRRTFTAVTELDWWQAADLDGVAVELVPSHHWTRRTLTDENDALWGGYVLSGKRHKAHFAGDTAYGKWFKEVASRHKGIDVTMMPIGAYEPRWFMQNVHMDPDEAVQATLDLGAKRLASMHWGTYVLTREPVLEPPERVRAAWAKTGRPREDLWDLRLGETRVVP